MEAATFVCFIPVGRSERDLSWAADGIDALWHYQSAGCRAVLIVDDGNDLETRDRTLREVLGKCPPGCQGVILDHPDAGQGWGHYCRVNTALLLALSWVHQHEPAVDFLLKLDSDCLVLGPFAERIAACFHDPEYPDTGMVGAVLSPRDPAPDFSVGYVGGKIQKLGWPVSLWRRPRWNVRGFWSHRVRRLRRLVLAARANGYRWGEYTQGGAYAIGRQLIALWAETGLWDDLGLLREVPVGEDALFPMLAHSVGMRLKNMGGAGEVFGAVRPTAYPLPAVEALTTEGFAHSLKEYGPNMGMRARLQARRRRAAPGDAD